MEKTGDRGIYRFRINSPDLTAVTIREGESNLYILSDRPDRATARKVLQAGRAGISSYLTRHPSSGRSLLPLLEEEEAPVLVQKMARAARSCGVGPMAAVAGVLADAVGEALSAAAETVIVENGGDIYLVSGRSRIISLYAGEGNKFTGRLGIKIAGSSSSRGIAASSRRIGPSLNWGRSDLTVVLAETCALADAAATALSNRIHCREKPVWEEAIAWIREINGVTGGLIIMGDQLQAWGEIELVSLSGSRPDQEGTSSLQFP